MGLFRGKTKFHFATIICLRDINEKLKGVCLTAIQLNFFHTFRTPEPGGSVGGAKNFNKTVSNVKLNLKSNGTIPGLLRLFIWEI